jgi:hypothetical protein
LLENDNPERSSACRPFAIAQAYPLGQGTPPNQQMAAMDLIRFSGQVG